MTISENFEYFQGTLTLKQIFWKTKTFFKKLEYSFLVKSTKIENISDKTAKSEANVKTNRMVSQSEIHVCLAKDLQQGSLTP